MNLYNIGYKSCEESEYTQLIHEKKYTYKQLEEIVHSALKKAYDGREIIYDYDFTMYHEFHDKVIEILCEEHGFKKVTFTASWSCFGWASIDEKDDWSGYREENDTLSRFYDKYFGNTAPKSPMEPASRRESSGNTRHGSSSPRHTEDGDGNAVKPELSDLVKYRKPETEWKSQYNCPECQWDSPLDFPDDMYIVIEKEGYRIIFNYWKEVIDDQHDKYSENKEVTTQIKQKIYPVRENGWTDGDGIEYWDETHCCPVHGEFTFQNGSA